MNHYHYEMLCSELYSTWSIRLPKRECRFQHTNMSIYTSTIYKLCLGYTKRYNLYTTCKLHLTETMHCCIMYMLIRYVTIIIIIIIMDICHCQLSFSRRLVKAIVINSFDKLYIIYKTQPCTCTMYWISPPTVEALLAHKGYNWDFSLISS